MTTNEPTPEGLSSVGAAFDAAAEKAAKTTGAEKVHVEANVEHIKGPVPEAARNVTPSAPAKPSLFSRAAAWAAAWIAAIRAVFHVATRPITLVLLVVGLIIGAFSVQNTRHTTFMNLHGDLHGAGFFRNTAFKLDTSKETTIHTRGTNVEAVTLRDSKGRLYRPASGGGWLQVK